jgi:hypothetical protein
MATTTATLSDDQRAFLQQPFVGEVTTLRADGSPHSTVVCRYPWHNPDQQRIIVRIHPEQIDSYGLDG